MGSKLVKKELQKVQFADLSDYNKETRTYKIPKNVGFKIDVGNSLLIKLDAYILNKENNVLATNWNKGSIPQYSYYKIEITKIMGKMILVDGLAFDYETNQDISDVWSGWLPLEHISIVKRL